MYCNTSKNIDHKEKCIDVENMMEYCIERWKNMLSKERTTFGVKEASLIHFSSLL
jgi:hypothetical protein